MKAQDIRDQLMSDAVYTIIGGVTIYVLGQIVQSFVIHQRSVAQKLLNSLNW